MECRCTVLVASGRTIRPVVIKCAHIQKPWHRVDEKMCARTASACVTVTKYRPRLNVIQNGKYLTCDQKLTSINGALPLKAARSDAIWGFESELRTNLMAFYLDSPLIPLRARATDWQQNRALRAGRNCGTF